MYFFYIYLCIVFRGEDIWIEPYPSDGRWFLIDEEEATKFDFQFPLSAYTLDRILININNIRVHTCIDRSG